MSSFLRTSQAFTQVVLLALIFLIAQQIAGRFHSGIPAGVLGLLGVLGMLMAGLLPSRHLAAGARWLHREMLLFFVPAVIAVIQYPDLVVHYGLAILAVIVGSTLCVMAATALAVDLVWRIASRRKGGES